MTETMGVNKPESVLNKVENPVEIVLMLKLDELNVFPNVPNA